MKRKTKFTALLCVSTIFISAGIGTIAYFYARDLKKTENESVVSPPNLSKAEKVNIHKNIDKYDLAKKLINYAYLDPNKNYENAISKKFVQKNLYKEMHNLLSDYYNNDESILKNIKLLVFYQINSQELVVILNWKQKINGVLNDAFFKEYYDQFSLSILPKNYE